MIVLDTSVVSELMRAEPHEQVVEWTDRQPVDEVFITAIAVAELLYGIGRLPAGRRRGQLADLFEEIVAEDFERRRRCRHREPVDCLMSG